MSETEIIRLSRTINAAVVQLPERQHPGVVIQGDTLQNLARLLEEIAVNIRGGDLQEALAVVAETREILAGYIDSYDDALAARDQTPPRI